MELPVLRTCLCPVSNAMARAWPVAVVRVARWLLTSRAEVSRTMYVDVINVNVVLTVTYPNVKAPIPVNLMT